MARFRTVSQGTKTENLAGGQAYKESPKLELVSMVLTSFVQDQYYRSADESLKKLQELIKDIDKKFVAKTAIFARNEFGMRSITHALIGELTKTVKGEEWVKRAVEKTVRRPDDMLEILAYVGKPIPNSLKKGLRTAVSKFDRYQLSKYRGENSNFKLVDLFNLVHPVPQDDQEDAFKALVDGKLKADNTWEKELTQAGQKATNEEEKVELKKNAWTKLIKEKKIGYFALLRNLRNIEEQAKDLIPDACEMLVDEKLIKKSLVLPFRFQTAMNEVSNRTIKSALNKAIEISLSNVPKFDGKTLVVVDTSGSMQGRPMEIASLFAAILYKANDADIMRFDTSAGYYSLNPDDTVATLASKIRPDYWGGTAFKVIFPKADKAYDRVIILSDMQGWVGYYGPGKTFSNYKDKFNCNPFVYSFDLQGYGSLQFPEQNVFCLAGFSEKIFEVMKLLEEDRNALVNKIEAIEL